MNDRETITIELCDHPAKHADADGFCIICGQWNEARDEELHGTNQDEAPSRLKELQSQQRIDRAIRAILELTQEEAAAIDERTPYCMTLAEIRNELDDQANPDQQDFFAELDASHEAEPAEPPEEDHPHPKGWECGQCMTTITPLPQPDPKPLPFVERTHPEWELMWSALANRIRQPGQSDEDAFYAGDGWQYMNTQQLANGQPVHNFRNRSVNGVQCSIGIPPSESYTNVLLGTYTRKD